MVTQVEKISNEKKETAEAEIRDKRKSIDYSTLEYPIEIIVNKYLAGIEEDENELFIPDYQREMAWDDDRQSKFIESILLGLPIPYIFVADFIEDECESEDLARLEIIDGTQRIRTLARFLNNELILYGLQKLEKLNGFRFDDLPLGRQRRFKRNSIRMIQLTENADEETRRDLFERINSGSLQLNEMEKRRGILRGQLQQLVDKLSKNKKFIFLCSFETAAINRRDPEQFVLRFFAFLNKYEKFNANQINEFLDEYLNSGNNDSDFDGKKMQTEFLSMVNFIEQYFPNGFRDERNLKKTTTRIKFESLSVGVALALRQKSDVIPKSTDWIKSKEFKKITSADGSSSRVKVIKRIEYVRDKILGL